MIGWLKGTLLRLVPEGCLIDTGGVAYLVRVPQPVQQTFPGPGSPVSLAIYTLVREDSWQLFGFPTWEERSLFATLLGVSGVGPKAALSLLSTLPWQELVVAVARSDAEALAQAPGVGRKTAERIVVELREKLAASLAAAAPGGAPPGRASGRRGRGAGTTEGARGRAGDSGGTVLPAPGAERATGPGGPAGPGTSAASPGLRGEANPAEPPAREAGGLWAAARDAVLALLSLGYSQQEARAAVQAVLGAGSGATDGEGEPAAGRNPAPGGGQAGAGGADLDAGQLVRRALRWLAAAGTGEARS
ncbi:MAG: Holliday junction branch migration protein RuvA [Firmicutes bacterium]|nr:Holliday junction branch migration protein RuvA [Bacillota bacterium]